MTESEKIKMILKSPFFLSQYLIVSGRGVNASEDDSVWFECPSVQCHSKTDERTMEGLDNTATLVRERGTGIARLYCIVCHSSWDIFSLYEADHNCDRATAIKQLGDFVAGLITDEPDECLRARLSDDSSASNDTNESGCEFNEK